MAIELGAHLMSLVDQLRYHPTSKRIRAGRDGVPVLDTTSAMVVWEPRRVVPMYAVPPGDISATLTSCEPVELPAHLPPVLGPVNFGWHLHDGRSFDVEVGGETFPAAAFAPASPELDGRVVVEWAPFEWVEENAAVTGHPHDPFKRLDVLASDRHLVVAVDGVTLADSQRGIGIYETHLPTRWYFPRDDVRMDLLTPSTSTSTCAYKGHATYFSIRDAHGDAGRDVAWTYVDPLHEVAAVKDHICFYNERVDLSIDGSAVSRPSTPWSSPRDQERF